MSNYTQFTLVVSCGQSVVSFVVSFLASQTALWLVWLVFSSSYIRAHVRARAHVKNKPQKTDHTNHDLRQNTQKLTTQLASQLTTTNHEPEAVAR